MSLLAEILELRRLGLPVERELRSERLRLTAEGLQNIGHPDARLFYDRAEEALERRTK